MNRARVEVASSFQAPTKYLSVRIIRPRVPILMWAHGAKKVGEYIVVKKLYYTIADSPGSSLPR